MTEKLSTAKKRALLANLLQQKAAEVTTQGPLSYAQQALWFLHQNLPNSAAYNVAFSVSIYSAVDIKAMQSALQRLVNRHELLRTTFSLHEGMPVQIVHGFKVVDFSVVEADGENDEALQQQLLNAYQQPFDLEKNPALRVRLFKRAENHFVLLMTFHHIICDAWSIWLLLDEFLQLYTAETSGQDLVLPKHEYHYAEYIKWQHILLQGESGSQLAAYWKEQLTGYFNDLNLPVDRPRPAIQKQQGLSYRFVLSAELAEALHALCKAEGVTLYMMLMSAFQVLLHRYSGQTNILVGSPSAGRNQSDFATTVGLFVNQIVLRGDFENDPQFLNFLQQMRTTSLGALVHQDYPFYYLVQQLQPKRDPSRSPIFQSYFILQKPQQELGELSRLLLQQGDETVNLAGLEMQLYDLPQMEGQFDLTLEMFDQGENLAGTFKYNSDLFDESTIVRLAEHFDTLLHGIVTNPNRQVSQLPLMTETENKQLLSVWNATQTNYPLNKTLHQWIQEQVERTPEAIAVVFENQALSYRELNQQANRLAHWLIQNDIKADVLVGVCLERSLDLVISLLAILKAGGAYLPLDPSYPKNRLAFMLADASPRVILTEETYISSLADLPENTRCFCFDRDRVLCDTLADFNPSAVVMADHLAYTIYTSGSTGKPKGAMNSHKAICNRLLWMQEVYQLTVDDRILQKTPFSFDVSVWEFFWPLMSGASLVLAKPEGHKDSAYLAQMIAKQGITHLHFVPSMLQNFLQEANLVSSCKTLKQIVCSGEALSVELQKQFFQQLPKVKLDNLYGPTEAAIDVSFWPCRNDLKLATVPIGKPIANTQLYLLDNCLQPVPIGVAAELFIAGVGLARGYLNRAELTAEKFIPNPFSKEPNAKLYRTGDLARYLGDGNIEYLGRLDQQVKIRGFRIELGEIENTLLALPDIRDAVVTVDQQLEDQRLVAYVVPNDGKTLSVSVLRQNLEASLPSFMVPAFFIIMESFALTASGKLDRRALPTIQQSQLNMDSAFDKAETEAEQRLVQIWQDVLNLDHVGIHDNFFELGGHSLLLTQVHRKLQQNFSNSPDLVELFQYPTIQTLAKRLAPSTIDDEAEKRGIHTKKLTEADKSIAIIGMAGRFPGADNVEQFWQNLCEGVESITFFSDEELLAAGVSADLIQQADYVKANGALADIDLFAADFFEYTPREAELIDPQQRLLLECAWTAVENAGYDVERLHQKTGVFAGSGMNSYLLNNIATQPEIVESAGGFQVMISNDKDFLSTRIAYKLNLQGPAVVVQSACSTSLVAVHQACQSLLSDECYMALAGGVSVRSRQTDGYLYQEGMILSPDGHCRAFDAKAQGTIGASGAGIVVLKRLSDAMADKDHIYAVLKNSAVNNDGSLKVGYTAPSIEGQTQVISSAMQGLDYERMGYIEAHGTGTTLGDPIEVTALTQAYRAQTKKNGFCALGSLKTNVGHLDAAAGVAGLIKTALTLKNQLLPPSLHFEHPNSAINFSASPFFVNNKLTPWVAGKQPRRAAISSFGIGGTNAHAVLEEAPVMISTVDKRQLHLLVLSAKTPSALNAASLNLADFLRSKSDIKLADVAYTLAQGRKEFPFRRSLVCATVNEALSLLTKTSKIEVLGKPSVVMMFPGQGAQYVEMALELYQHESYFREQLELCANALKAHVDFDLIALLYPEPEQRDSAIQRLSQTAITQPTLFAIEYALAKLWQYWGVSHTAMLGHSIGEYVAACLAGVFSLDDALMLVAKRGKLMQSLPSGSMLSVALTEQEISAWLTPELSLAAINAPQMCVVSGRTALIDALESQLTENNIACVYLHTSHAFHSEMMTSILEEFTGCVNTITLNPPSIPYLSNVSGDWILVEQATSPDYWAAHLRQPVRFNQCVQTLLKQTELVFLETGPGQVLTGLVKQQPEMHAKSFHSLPHPKHACSAYEVMLSTLAELWCLGVKIDWNGFYADQPGTRLPLPSYPFERQRCWIDSGKTSSIIKPVISNKKRALDEWFYYPSWQPKLLDVTAISEPVKQLWLVFADNCGFTDGLVKRFLKHNARVINVSTGTSFSQTDSFDFIVNPNQKEDFSQLFNALEGLPVGIIYAWPVTDDSALVEELESVCLNSLLYLSQAIGDINYEATIRLTVFSNNMQALSGELMLETEKALLLGPVKVIAQEYPSIATQSIDIVWPQVSNIQSKKLLSQLYLQLIQVEAPVSHQSIFAWRDQQRWVKTLQSIEFKSDLEGIDGLLVKQGVYLITGGLGGIGLVLAEYLSTKLQAKLVLIGRSDLPPREQWSDWLSNHQENDALSLKINAVQQLEANGSEVMVAGIDVADRQQMKVFLKKAQADFGSINGVIHAAGVACGGMIQHKEPAVMQGILAAKVEGSKVLAELFADTELGFMVFCSSLSAIRGDFGQVDYCAANAFMDSLSHQLQRQGKNCLTINWDIWQQVGMAINVQLSEQMQDLHKENLKCGITSEEGVEAFNRVLSYGQTQTVLSTRDIHYWYAVNDSKLPLPQQKTKVTDAVGEYIPPSNEFEIKLAEIWQELLGFECIGIHEDFFELGGHSLLAIQVIARIRKFFNVNLTLQVFFTAPTIEKMAEHLLITQLSQLDSDELDELLN